MKSVGLAVLALVLFLGLGWVFMGNDLAMRKVFAPAHEQVRRETFEQSKAYQQGMVQELRNMQFAYIQADSEHKVALASVIRHRYADYPTDQLPPDLRQFLKEIQ